MDSHNELNDSVIFIKYRNTILLLRTESLTALESNCSVKFRKQMDLYC